MTPLHCIIATHPSPVDTDRQRILDDDPTSLLNEFDVYLAASTPSALETGKLSVHTAK